MPMVNGKEYPYTAEGKKDAAMAKRSALKQRLIGTGAKINKVEKQTQNRKGVRFGAIGGLGTDLRQNQRDYDARTRNLEMLKEKNMPKRMNGGSGMSEKTGMKSPKVNKEAGFESMTGMTRAQKIAEMRKAGVSEAAIKAALGE
jgi:hypothetical protein